MLTVLLILIECYSTHKVSLLYFYKITSSVHIFWWCVCFYYIMSLNKCNLLLAFSYIIHKHFILLAIQRSGRMCHHFQVKIL